MADARGAKSGDKRKKRYSPQFRQDALAKLNTGNYSLRALAAELGVTVVTLLNWRRSGATPRAGEVIPNSPADQDEIARLRAEIAELKQERARLRKGIAILVGIKEVE